MYDPPTGEKRYKEIYWHVVLVLTYSCKSWLLSEKVKQRQQQRDVASKKNNRKNEKEQNHEEVKSESHKTECAAETIKEGNLIIGMD